MGEIKSSIVLDLQGNLERQAERSAAALGRLGSRGSRSMQILDRSLGAVGSGLDRLGNRYTALLTGAAGVGTARFLIGLEERFTMLGIQANVSGDQVEALKNRIYEVSRAPKVRIDPSELTSAVEDIIEKTGDLKFAQDNLENFAVAISATGGKSGAAIGQIAAEFQKMGITSKKDVGEALEILTVQGKAGAFTLQNLAALGSRTVTAYTAMGRTGVPAIREMGAALQVIRQGTGSAEMAATAWEALLRVLSDSKKVKMLQQGGIKVFDEEALKKGKEVLLPVTSILKDIIRQVKGKRTVLDEVIGDAEAMRAFNATYAEFSRTNNFASLDKFLNVQANGNVLLADSERAAHGAGRALQNLYSAWQIFADHNLSGPLQSAADALNSLDSETVDRWLKVAGIGAGVLGAAVIGRKVYQGGRAVMGLFGKGGAGELAGKAGFGDAIPVYVVNGPASIWPGADGAEDGGGSAAAKAGKWATVGAVAAPLIAPAGMAVAALASEKIGKTLAESEAKHTSTASLKEIYARNDVLGGGGDNYQGKLIKAELSGRDVFGTVRVELSAPPGWATKATEITAKNLDLEVDSGQMMRGH